MAAYIGQIEPYDGSSDLEAYLERLELYFVANNVGTVASGADQAVINAADRKRVATLLTLVGPETYLLLKSLVSPRLPADLLFQEITDTLKSHLKPRRLTVAERYKFHQRSQKDSEGSLHLRRRYGDSHLIVTSDNFLPRHCETSWFAVSKITIHSANYSARIDRSTRRCKWRWRTKWRMQRLNK